MTTNGNYTNQAFAGMNGTTSHNVHLLQKDKGFTFYSFFHPYTTEFIKRLNKGGVPALMATDTDLSLNDNGDVFKDDYDPTNLVTKSAENPRPKVNIDFDYDRGAYSLYNWELFFHAPLYIATRLSKNGKYAEAMKWFHYIFNPTTNEKPDSNNPNAHYWQVLPFKTTPVERIEEFFKALQANPSASNDGDPKIAEWREHPFKPHLIARGRPLAYMKNVIFKYVENCTSWGDELFRRDTIESINEATQLYIIAAHILGRLPQLIPKRGTIKAETYASLRQKLDDFSNAAVQLENLFPFSSAIPYSGESPSGTLLGFGETLYFGIPHNETMRKYWDTVADRLFKIRHCMNIEGVERKLALFEPPIDPAMLVAAAAKGLSLSEILGDMNSPAPFYRFNYLTQKATELCAEVKALGNALLSTIEKRDAEELALIRAQNETGILSMITAIKERQVLETKAAKQGLEKSRIGIKKRMEHYLKLLADNEFVIPEYSQLAGKLASDSALPETIIEDKVIGVDVSIIEEGGVKLISTEKLELDESKSAHDTQKDVSQIENIGNTLHLIPDFMAAAEPFGCGAAVKFGGTFLGLAMDSWARSVQQKATDQSFRAGRASKMATFTRRDQEFVFHFNTAKNEMIQIDKQIAGAEIRTQIAEIELANHQQQIANSVQVEEYMKNKFSNQELYQWMKEQLFFVYKQSYQLAYDMAKKAEKAYRFELGITDTNFIQYGYWDSSYQGLVSGEQLHLAIKQMEKAYIEANRREFELTKSISLAILNPLLLLQLKQTGSCEIDLPEELFDLDYPGHYFRRVKSVSLSIPCVAGPHTTINSTLRLLNNSIRINTFLGENGQYEHNNEEGIPIDDLRFMENNIPFKAIATSSAQNDSGVFELNFRDERFLPFEGSGAISKWKIELNGKYVLPEENKITDFSQFDYNSISDVIIHLRYTAREDAGKFRANAIEHLNDYFTHELEKAPQPFMRLFSLRHDFPDAFHQLLNLPGNIQNTEIQISKNHFPIIFNNRTITANKTQVFIRPKSGQTITAPTFFNITIGDEQASASDWIGVFNTDMIKSTFHLGEVDPVQLLTITAGDPNGNEGLQKEEVDDVLIYFEFFSD